HRAGLGEGGVRIAVLLLAACSAFGDPGGSPAPVGGTPKREPTIVGDVCTSVGQALCFRRNACDGTGVDDCLRAFVDACCEHDHTCPYRSPVKQGQIDACAAALAGDPCGALLDAAVLPASCSFIHGALQPPG